LGSRGSRFWDFFGFSISEFGLAKEFWDQSRKRVFLYLSFYRKTWSLPVQKWVFWAQKGEKVTK
jgi:hypothetical protein